MCGRFTLKTKAAELAKRFAVDLAPLPPEAFFPRYNIAPSAGVLTVWDDRDAQLRKADFFHWGLVPHWANDVKIGYKLTNARSETAAVKPSFRDAMRYRRCILPVDGFFEWKREGGVKQPYYFSRRDGGPLAMAGLWELWQSPDGSEIFSATILTTRANALMTPVHDRMPVVIPEAELDRWLNPFCERADEVADLLTVPDEAFFTAHPVSSAVNNARHEGPELILPLDQPPEVLPPRVEQGELF